MTVGYTMERDVQKEQTLIYSVGQSVCAVQHLEDALSHSIVLKKLKPPLRSEADRHLEKHRSYTLGNAIKIAEEAQLYPASLEKELKELLSERNWLIHRSIAQNRDDWDLNIRRDELIDRVRAVATHALKLQRLIEENLIEFSEANGIDMSQVKAEMAKHK